MKRFCLLFCLLASMPLFAASPRNPVADGTCKGIKLYGRVKVVNDASATFTVRLLDVADLDVKIVSSNPRECGEWQFVTNGSYDFTVRFTSRAGYEDFTMRFVNSSPGPR